MGPPIICAACGHENRETARFCEDCGSTLATLCTECGNELRPGASFCDSCGAAAEGSTEPLSVRRGETRKVVTVVFADLVGSTALQEMLDTESVRGVMTRFYDRMGAVVGAHGGSVEKFVGDGVVAAFGIPELHEDDAIRAVRAAAAMVSSLEDLNEEVERSWGVRLRMRAAVNTGELVVGPEGELVGDTMNTAARLEQAAAEGEILVSESTWRLVRHGLELEPVAPLKLKGKADPVRAWRLASISAADRRRTPAVEVSLVGRAGELERMRAGFDAAVSERQCRLVSILGSPGVGKTRLANEFGTHLGELANVVEGRCEPTGEGITFLPIAEVLRTVAGIGEADPADTVREKLGALTPQDEPDRLRLTERLAGVLGVGEPASAQETFWALRRGLEALARVRPLVLVLDDLHWGQPMLLDLVEHLVEWVRDAPVLIVALARPELREVREALAHVGRRARDVIELEPLDEDESRELVSGLLGQARVPQALSARILETTEGNPLFLGETVRMLVDEGLLQREGEEWVAGGAVTTVEVPPTIQALLAARIERLRTDERSVVERAAVIGKQFYRGAVADLVAPPVRREIDGHLEALRRKDMVEPDGTYWIDEPVYRFHHVLIRDAAYRSLLKEARAELHERFADWLEVKAGELVGEHEEVIAFHLEQAHEYRRQLGQLDEHGQALGARATARLHSAGRRALAREDLAAAANLLGRALARDSGDESGILWDLAEALLSAGDTSAGAPVVERLESASAEDRKGLARAAILRGQLANLTGAGPIPETAESVTAAATALAELGDEAGAAKGWQVAAGAYARLGQVAAVEESLDRALGASRAAGDQRRTTAVLAGAPRAALWGPSPVVRASGRCLDVVRILRMTPGNRHVEAIALRCQAVLEAMRGRVQAAREILAAGRATLEELGLALELYETAIHAGIVELLADEPSAAVEHLRSAREGFEALGVAAGAAQAAALLAQALVAEGGSDSDALSQTRFAEAHGGEDLKTTITWCSARAEALARTGEIEQALSFARRAMSLADPTDALADKADASMAMARVLSLAGQDAEAREAARAAREWYEAKGHVVGVDWAERMTGEAGSRRAEAPGRTAPAVGERLPERWYAEYKRSFDTHDINALVELYEESWMLVDHRAVGWEDLRGRDAGRKLNASLFASSHDAHAEIDEVLACDSRVIAVRMRYHGTGKRAGDWEFRVGQVTVVEDGRSVSMDQYEYDDEAAMLARYAELEGEPRPVVGALVSERLNAEFARRYSAHDLEGLLDLYHEDFVMTDHRSIGWEGSQGLDALRDVFRSGFGISSDAGFTVGEVIACDDRVIALRGAWGGPAVDGGGDWELPVGLVTLNDGHVIVSSDLYEPDDIARMIARYAELGGGLSALGDRPPERWWREYARWFAARDADRLRELYGGESVWIDHRNAGWVECGPAVALEHATSGWAGTDDIRVEVGEVFACDDRTIALSFSYLGTTKKRDGGGLFALALGAVVVVEANQVVSFDQYEPDDHAAMLARYAGLGGHRSVTLGDRPPERWYAEYLPRHAARDIEGALELYTEGFVMIDHRPLGWEEVRGRPQLGELYQSVFNASPGIRAEVDEVLACDERVIAMRLSYRGHGKLAGEFEDPAGYVTVVEDGLAVRIDVYHHADDFTMLRRYHELGGRPPAIGDRPPEQLVAKVTQCLASGDIDRLMELYAEDVELIDHRAMPWENARSRDELTRVYRSGFATLPDLWMDVDEVLACDHRVIAQRYTLRAHASDGGGETALPIGSVNTIEGGQWKTIELYEPDDRAAMMARYAELIDKRPTSLQPAPDPLVRDRRGFPAVDARGIDAYRALIGDRDPRVVAHDGDLMLAGIDDELPLFVVAKLHEGQVVEAIVLRDELRAQEWLHALTIARRFEEASVTRDTEGLLAGTHPEGRIIDHRPLQFQDAATPDGIRDIYTGLGKLLARPHASVEVLDVHPGALAETVTWSAIDRSTGGAVEWKVFHAARMRDGLTEEIHSYAEVGPALEKMEALSPAAGRARISRLFIEALGAQDWPALAELYSDDCVFVEHRALTDEGFAGVGGLISVFKAMLEMVTEHHVRGELIRDQSGEVFLRQINTGNWHGGPWEAVVDSVAEVRDGLLTRIELFDPNQRELRSARLAGLAAQRHDGLSMTPWKAQLADDLTLTDHRLGGSGTLHGAAAVSARLGDEISGDRLASAGEADLVALPDGSFGVTFCGQDRKVAHVELYDHEQAARGRFAVVEAGLVVFRVGIALFQALNRRDMAAARACLTDDLLVIEHRPLSGFPPELRTGDAYLELLSSLMELSDDIRWFYTDPGEVTDGVGRTKIVLTGHWNAGGGWAEIPVGVVFALRDGRYERMELYPPEATAEMKTRMAELVEDRRAGGRG